MLGINRIDWFVIVGYFLVITLVGIWASKRVKSSASFFIGDRKFGKLMMIFFAFGSGTSTDEAVGVSAKAYRVGAAGIWYQWLWLFVTPFYWLIAPLFRRMRAVTTADYFVYRYNRSVGVLYAILAMLQLMVGIGVMLKSSSTMLIAVSGGTLSPGWTITAMTLLFILYGVAGGLNAAILTDFIQGIMTVIFSFVILPFALHKVGGITGLRESLNDETLFHMIAPKGSQITVFYVIIISINALIGIVTQPQTMGMGGSGKTEMEGRVGMTYGSFIKRICTMAWVLIGMCAIAVYVGKNINIDYVYGQMGHDLLSPIAPGLVGLFIASMLAAVMSSCDASMVMSAGLFVDQLYRPFLAPKRSDRHYVYAGRISSALLVGISLIFAFEFENVVHGLETFWMVAALMGISFWVGLFWRRATVAGAWAATIVSFLAFLFTGRISLFGKMLWDFNASFAGYLPDWMTWTENGQTALLLPWQMIIYLAVGFITCIIVSLFTRPVNKDQLDRFYSVIHTPVQQEEPEGNSFELPPGMEPAPRRPLFCHPDFEVMKPSFVGVAGFLFTWFAVGALLLIFYGILQR